MNVTERYPELQRCLEWLAAAVLRCSTVGALQSSKLPHLYCQT